MKRLFFFCALTVALQSAYCQQQETLTELQRVAIRDSVTQMTNRFCDEERANPNEAILDCFDDSPEFLWVFPPDTTVISRDAQLAIVKAEAPLYRSIDPVWDYMRVEPLTNRYAVFTGRSHTTMIDTSGRVFKFTGVTTGIVVHRPGGWKFLNGQTYEVPLKNQ